MASEIRANTLKNRVGLGTVSFTNTGPVVSGIVTIANSTAAGVRLEDNAGVGGSLKITTPSGYVSIGAGNAAFVHINTDRGSYYFQKRIIVDEGIIGSYDENLTLQSPLNTNRVTINKDTGLFSILNDLDVDGHTNLDNVSIAGVTTTTDDINIDADNKKLLIGDSQDLELFHDGGTLSYIRNNTGKLVLRSDTFQFGTQDGAHRYIDIPTDEQGVSLFYDNVQRLATTSTGAQIDTILLLYGAAGNPGRLRLQEGGALSEILGTRNSDANSDLQFKTERGDGTQVRAKIDYSGHFIPGADSTHDLGLTGTRWRNVYADTLYGDGSNLTGISGVSVANQANNRLITATGTTDALNAETALTFYQAGNDSILTIEGTNSAGHAQLTLKTGGTTDHCSINFGDSADHDAGEIRYTNSSDSLNFDTAGTPRMVIDSDGDLGIGDLNPNIRLTVVDTGTENLVRLGRSDASGHASHTVNVKASKDFYHHFKMEASSFNLDTYNGSAMIEAFKVHNTGYAELAGAADIRLTLGNYGTAGSNGANWVRGTNSSLYYNAGAGIHLWEIGGAEHMRLNGSGNLYLRSESANYVVLGNSGDATSNNITNSMNWIRGNQTHLQYNCNGGFHAWEVSGSQKMILSAGGDLGLNTANPASRLAIYDADGHNLTLSSHNWSGEARIGFTGGAQNVNGTANGSTAGAIGVTASAPGGQAVGYMSFYTNQGDNLQERIRINRYGGLKLFNSSSNISGTDTGALFYNTLEKRVKVYNGNTWTNTDIASDPYWSNVVLLIAGASTITDASGRHTPVSYTHLTLPTKA